MIKTFSMNNMDFEFSNYSTQFPDVIYSDFLYENLDFSWFKKYWSCLNSDGVFICQTDWHSQHRLRVFIESNFSDAVFVNELVVKGEWGNHPKNKFHQCYDNVIIYAKGRSWKFDSSKIQVPKKTLTKGLNPSGRTTKTATAWGDDVTLTTTAKERVKKNDGKLIRWQKPLALYDRIIAPFVDRDSLVLDIFMGSGSLGKWCKRENLDYVGVELDSEVYRLALGNIFPETAS